CPHHRVGDYVHQKLDCALLLGLRYETLDSSGVDRAGVDIHGGAGLQRIGDNEPHDEGERRQHLEIDEGLQADAANLLHILHAGNAVHDRTEDDRRDDHLDRLNEGVPQGLHLLAQLWIEMTEQHAEHDRGQHLEIEALKERPVAGSQFGCGGFWLPPPPPPPFFPKLPLFSFFWEPGRPVFSPRSFFPALPTVWAPPPRHL